MKKIILTTLVLLLMPIKYSMAQVREVIPEAEYEYQFLRHIGQVTYFSSWGFNKTNDERRILVNDLNVSNKSDLDFNDLVFDAKFTDKGARITLRAVGTTSPIRIGGKEAHELFGIPSNSVINTIEITKDPVSFDIEGDFEGDYNNIRVEMQSTKGDWIVLFAHFGAFSTNKLAVPTTVKWCMENEFIVDIYPDSRQYLLYKDCKWWENYKGTLGIQPISTDNPAKDLYSIKGNKLQFPSKGINIIKMSDGTTKKVLIK